MSAPNSRSRAVIPMAFVVLLIITASAFWKYRASAAALASTARDTEQCAHIAEEITALRELPQLAVLEAESDETIINHIVDAAENASIKSRSIARIQPDPFVSLGESSYRIRPVRTDVNQVTLEQLISFAHRLVDEKRGLTVRDLRLSHPVRERAPSALEMWNIELTLTQLIFSPNSRHGR
jgi:hypothetical protein